MTAAEYADDGAALYLGEFEEGHVGPMASHPADAGPAVIERVEDAR